LENRDSEEKRMSAIMSTAEADDSKKEDVSPSFPPTLQGFSPASTPSVVPKQQQNDIRNQRYIVILMILIVLVGGVVVFGLISALEDNPNPSSSKTPSPTTTPSIADAATSIPSSASVFISWGGDDIPQELTPEDRKALLDVFSSAVGELVFVNGTTQAMAADWIFYEDPRRNSTTSRRDLRSKLLESVDEVAYLQRYLLVFFYFSTTENRQEAWLSCGEPSSDDEVGVECVFQKLDTPAYDENRGPDDLVFTEIPWIRWLTAAHECDWAGVSCITSVEGMRQVTDIDLGKSF
jgi:hypothetical protein